MKTFKNLCLLMLLSACSVGYTFSQEEDVPEKGGGKRKEKIQQFKIAYFTEELKLTVAESEKFWPLYNEMEDKIKANRKDIKKVADEIAKNQDSFSDDDYKKQVNKIFDLEASQATIKKEYYAKIAEAIGYKKATKLLKIEKEFKQKLMKELKKRKDQRPPHPGPPPQGPPPRGR